MTDLRTLCIDTRDAATGVPSGSIDVVVVFDPLVGSGGVDTPLVVWDEAYRVLTPGGRLVALCNGETADRLPARARLAGFELDGQMRMLRGGHEHIITGHKAGHDTDVEAAGLRPILMNILAADTGDRAVA